MTAAAAAVVHASDRTRVTRLALDGPRRAAQCPEPRGQRHGPDGHTADLPGRGRHRVANLRATSGSPLPRLTD